MKVLVESAVDKLFAKIESVLTEASTVTAAAQDTHGGMLSAAG
jgi:hypothetical protein